VRGAGGRDPAADGPEGAWRDKVGCDGPGFVAWCLGYDRYQPGFVPGWDWVGPDAMLAEAETASRWFAPLAGPEPGALVVYPSIALTRDGHRDRVGHVGIVVQAPPHWGPTAQPWAALRVVHCTANLWRRQGHAIGETHGVAWSGRASFRGRAHPHWRARFLRYAGAGAAAG
jgi:hypothetical protein